MYGLLCLNANCLSFSEQNVAKSHLCGLCNSISSKYGFGRRALTNYDAAFVSLLYSSQSKGRIPAQKCPFKLQKTKGFADAGLDFATALSLIMAKVKIDDDALDSNSYVSHFMAKALNSVIPLAINDLKKLGFNLKTISYETGRQEDLERHQCSDFDELASPTENSVSTVFSHTATLANKESNSRPLSNLGKNIGKLMYLLDSYADLPKDTARGKFNALSTCYPQQDGRQLRKTAEKISSNIMKEISLSIKHLDLYQHERLIREGLLSSLKGRLHVLLSQERIPRVKWSRFLGSGDGDSAVASSIPNYGGKVRCWWFFEYYCNPGSSLFDLCP